MPERIDMFSNSLRIKGIVKWLLDNQDQAGTERYERNRRVGRRLQLEIDAVRCCRPLNEIQQCMHVLMEDGEHERPPEEVLARLRFRLSFFGGGPYGQSSLAGLYSTSEQSDLAIRITRRLFNRVRKRRLLGVPIEYPPPPHAAVQDAPPEPEGPVRWNRITPYKYHGFRRTETAPWNRDLRWIVTKKKGGGAKARLYTVTDGTAAFSGAYPSMDDAREAAEQMALTH